MDVGIVLPVEGEQANRQTILAVARSAEDLGYHSIWVTDRLLKPLSPPGGYPYSQDRGQIAFRPDRNWLDPMAVMGLVAGATSRVQIGTSVLVLPYRNPIVVAQEAASLDALSDGRIVLGVGIGWMAEEFAAVGVSVQERARRAEEYIALMRKLWAHPEGTSFTGRSSDPDRR
jgi:alkanesulfonate monooxygenase SsuD/methylene tetrahydromethanopterin reductase-like flavin-dependent oxidoreductase (luciferase family)